MPRNADRLDMSVTFQPVNIAVMTVSDTRTEADDKSGSLLVSRIEEDGHVLADRAIITDDVPRIIAKLKEWIESPQVDVVVTTGGTGLTGRDSTPEAFAAIVERRTFRDSASCSGCCPSRRSALRRFSRARLLGLPAGPTCSRFPDRHPPARTDGTIFCATSSTSVTGRATSSRSCRA